MKTFKTFLAEASMVSNLDVRKFGIDEIIECYENAGYEVPKNERKFFIDSKYDGYKNKSHAYVVMMEDDNEGGYYLTRFFLSLGSEGTLIAEPSGTPFFENDDEDVVQEKFDSL